MSKLEHKNYELFRLLTVRVVPRGKEWTKINKSLKGFCNAFFRMRTRWGFSILVYNSFNIYFGKFFHLFNPPTQFFSRSHLPSRYYKVVDALTLYPQSGYLRVLTLEYKYLSIRGKNISKSKTIRVALLQLLKFKEQAVRLDLLSVIHNYTALL